MAAQWAAKQKNGQLQTDLATSQTRLQNEIQHREQSEAAAAEWYEKYDQGREAQAQAQTTASSAEAKADAAQQQVALQTNELTELRERVHQDTAKISQLKTELDNARTQEKEKIDFLSETTERMQIQFKTLAQGVLDEKSRVFDKHSEKALAPLREKLEQFRRRVDEIYGEETRERAALKNEIKNLHDNAVKIGEDATNLTRALKGDKKIQGDWGELTLARLLEESGLREGESYRTQESFRDEDGNLQRPDVIIDLPENRHLIVDSKVSLVDYMNAVATDNDNDRNIAIDRHVQAIRRHVEDLSKRHYQHIKDIRTPDFVFMFMPQEAAFFAALNADPQLFSDAYNKKIIFCAPTTLLATLRTVERIWQLERQNKNAEDIARRGGALYDKLCGFVEDMEKLDKTLTGARNAYDAALGKLSKGQGNVIRQAEQLRDMGVRTKKQLPSSFAEDDEGTEKLN
jgi:DNA recombination protein RmuC